MKLMLAKHVTSFSKISNISIFNYILYNYGILRTDCIKYLGVFLDSKLSFHQQVDYLFSHAIKLLGRIWTVTLSFSSLDSFMVLCVRLVR
jgi:hypothetical protein